jgi:hypothetical protein
MTVPPADPPADPPVDSPAADERPHDGSSHALEEAARVRRSVAETIARVRKLTAGIGIPAGHREADDPAPPPEPEPPEAAAPPSAETRKDEEDDGRGLSGDVTALVERTRGIIARTRHLLDKSRRESAERKGE